MHIFIPRDKILIQLPLWGIGLFVLLYVLAAMLYPGGSNADLHARGFSVAHNYWCDLLGPYAKNGTLSPSRPVAMTAMTILCFSLMFFWHYLPRLFATSALRRNAIRFSGIGSMLVAGFISGRFHELVINLAGFLGVVAFSLTFIELYRNRLHALFRLGMAALCCCTATYIIYQTEFLLYILPVLQKVTFAVCLAWFGKASYWTCHTAI